MKPKLIDGPVGPMLIQLTIPMFWGLISILAFNLVDAYFVGKLGTSSLAAIGFTFPVILLFLNFAIGMGIGASSVMALAVGSGDKAKVQALTGHALILAMILLTGASLAGFIWMDPLFKVLGASEEMRILIREYMSPIFFGVPFLTLAMVSNSSLRAIGNTFWPGLGMGLSALVNLVLDPLLIFGWCGFPEMGLRGAAVATVISWVFSFIFSILILHYKVHLLCFKSIRENNFWQSARSILFVALPAAWTNMILPLAITVITSFLAVFGEWAVAAFGVAIRVEALMLVPLTALSAIIGPVVGQNWAAQKRDRVVESLVLIFKFCIYYGLICSIVLILTAHKFLPWFDKNPKVIECAFQFFLVTPVGYIGYGILMIVCATYNSLRKPFTSSLLSMSRAFLLYIPLAFLSKDLWGPIGIFGSATVANLVVSFIGALMVLHCCRYQDIKV